MATITKTKTWSFAETNEPTAANMNANFDTLYGALTTAGQVSHLDGSQAFTSKAILPAGEMPNDDTDAVGADYTWQQELEFLTGSSCWLHGGTHAFPSVSSLFLQATSGNATHLGLGAYDYSLPGTFPTDILAVVFEWGDSQGASFGTTQSYIDRAASTTSKIRIIHPSAGGVTVRVNLLLVGW